MRRFISHAIGAFVLALSFGARAQSPQPELEVTIDVVPPGAVADPEITPIPLPDDASEQGRESSLFGRTTAANARERGREFGEAVSEAARAARDLPEVPVPNFSIPKPPAK